jgi:hypothetical protein
MLTSPKNPLIGVIIKTVVLAIALYGVISVMKYVNEGGLNETFSFLVPSNTLTTPEKELKWCSDFAIFQWKNPEKFVRENDQWHLTGGDRILELPPEWSKNICQVKIQGFTLEGEPPKDFSSILQVTEASGKTQVLEFSASSGIYRYDGLVFRSTDLAAALQQLAKAAQKAGL